jgi:hypothetical protein
VVVKHIELTHSEWDALKQRLTAEYGMRILLSWVSRRELGFTVREHRHFSERKDVENWRDGRTCICLDFYDEAMKSWFLLKYQ